MKTILPVLILLLSVTATFAGIGNETDDSIGPPPSLPTLRLDTTLHLEVIINPSKPKVDKRGLFTFSSTWQNLDPYLGAYDVTKYQYLNFNLKYKLWFGLFASITPEFLFNKDSISYAGNYFELGVDREWVENFFASASYSYNVHQDNAIRTLRNLYRNDVNVMMSYENDYITPELKYDYTFGNVKGGKLQRGGGYKDTTVFGQDNDIELGISHTFIVFDSTYYGDFNVKLGNHYTFGTANALLTYREIVPNPNYNPAKKKGKAYEYLDFPYTGDKFSALYTEVNLTLDYTWRFLEITPVFNFSAPFRNLAAAQSAASTVIGPKGNEIVPPADIVSKPFVYGGVTLLFNMPYRKVKKPQHT